MLTPGAIIVRKGVHDRSGGFDERMGGCADWDMWLRLCRFGHLAFLNRVVVRYRLHDSNMNAQNALMASDELFLRKKLLSWPDETPERRQLAHWGYRLRSLQVSGYRLAWAKSALRAGQPLQSLKQLRHAARDACRYLFGPSICSYWPPADRRLFPKVETG